MTAPLIRVVKVGGSLLDLPDLAKRLHAWLASQPAGHHVLLAGGGSLVDQVRRWHAERPVAEVAAHWMCVDLLTVTAHFLHARLPEVWLEENDVELCRRVGSVGATIFGPAEWLRNAEPRLPGRKLPTSWSATSDAIAGRLAIALAADELVLLKSAAPAPAHAADLQRLAAVGYIDPVLATLADELPPVAFFDLRGGTVGPHA